MGIAFRLLAFYEYCFWGPQLVANISAVHLVAAAPLAAEPQDAREAVGAELTSAALRGPEKIFARSAVRSRWGFSLPILLTWRAGH